MACVTDFSMSGSGPPRGNPTCGLVRRYRVPIAVLLSVTTLAVAHANAPANRYLYVAVAIARASDPVIGYAPGSIEWTVEQGQSATASVARVWNCGSDMLTYTVAADDWLTVAPGPHHHLADDPDNAHVIALGRTDLPVGAYTGRVVIASADALYPEREVQVVLTVTEPSRTAAGIPFAWLRSYDLPTDGSVDHLDLDWDGHSVLEEWWAGTNPTDPASVLRVAEVEVIDVPDAPGIGVRIRWQSVADRSYRIERATNLVPTPVFMPIIENVDGGAGHIEHIDEEIPVRDHPVYYKIGVMEDSIP